MPDLPRSGTAKAAGMLARSASTTGLKDSITCDRQVPDQRATGSLGVGVDQRSMRSNA